MKSKIPKGKYEIGVQPCDNFKPEMEMDRENRHECPVCLGVRSFCLNCYKDHHENGWQTCKCDCERCVAERKKRLKSQDKREQL